MSTDAASSRRGQRVLGRLSPERLDLDRLARGALVVAVIASGLLLFHLTRGTSFWVDEWNFITGRRGGGVSNFLVPYQGHLSVIPVAIYRVMFAVFGIGSYTPYRVLVIASSLLVAILVFAYARQRVGELCALLITVLILFMGPGFQNTMWAFQVAWLAVAAAGIGALMLLDRHERRADIAACILILVALCSTSVGIAFAVGIAVDIALIRRRWRDAWIVAIPLVLYVIWVLHYHPSPVAWSQITLIPIDVAQAAAAALSVLTGLSGIGPFNDNGTAMTYGVPLLVLGSAIVGWLIVRGRFPARAITLVVILVTFVAMVTLVRAGIDPLLSSRYLYFYCLLVALLVAELARGIRPTLPVQLALCAVVVFSLVSNIGTLRAFGAYIRQSGATTNGALAALDLDRATVPRATLARIALYPYMRLPAGEYFAASAALGTPAYSASELLNADALGQTAADSQFVGDGIVTFSQAGTPPAAGSSPITVESATGGSASHVGGCVRFVPLAVMVPKETGTVTMTVPSGPGALSVSAGGAPVYVSFRRFAPTFMRLGAVQRSGSGVVTIHRDATLQPWHVQLQSVAPVRACFVR